MTLNPNPIPNLAKYEMELKNNLKTQNEIIENNNLNNQELLISNFPPIEVNIDNNENYENNRIEMRGPVPIPIPDIHFENEDDNILNEEKDINEINNDNNNNQQEVKKKKKIRSKKIKKKLDDDEKEKIINQLKEENNNLLFENDNLKINLENLQNKIIGINIPRNSDDNINNNNLKDLVEKYENENKELKEREENLIIENNILNETNDKLIDKLNNYEIENEKLTNYNTQLKEELDKYLNKENKEFSLHEDKEKDNLKKEVEELNKIINQNKNEIEILNNVLISKEEQIKNSKIKNDNDDNNDLKIEKEKNEKNNQYFYEKLNELEDVIIEKDNEIKSLEDEIKKLNLDNENLEIELNHLKLEFSNEKMKNLNKENLNYENKEKKNETLSQNEIEELKSKVLILDDLNNKLKAENEENKKKIYQLTINNNNNNNDNDKNYEKPNKKILEELKLKDIELNEALTKNNELTKMLLKLNDIDSSTHIIITTKTYKDLKWYLLSKNQDNNYESYIWVPQTKIDEKEYTSVDRNSLENGTIPLSKFNEVLLKLNDAEVKIRTLEEKNRKLKEKNKEKSNFDINDISELDKKSFDSIFSEGEMKKVFNHITEGNTENINKKKNNSVLSMKKDDTTELLKNQLTMFKEQFKESNEKINKISELFKDLLKNIKCDSKALIPANQICNILGFSPNTSNNLIKEKKKGIFGKNRKSKDSK